LDKVAATADVPQHVSKDFSLLGLGRKGFQSLFVASKIKRIVHAYDQGSGLVVTLILICEFLASKISISFQ
jgi:hypothetical protein